MERGGIKEESTSNVDTTIEIEVPYGPLVTSMRERLQSLTPNSSEYCIYRVPNNIRGTNEAAFAPIRVSIGPFHYGKGVLKAMEENKWRYLQNFLERTQKKLEEFVEVIKEKEESIRLCYAEKIKLDSGKFVEMILVDAAFIIEFLLNFVVPNRRDENDILFQNNIIFSDISRDLWLLENQIPFFILGDIFSMTVLQGASSSSQYEILSFLDLTSQYYIGMHLGLNAKKTIPSGAMHFTDFLRSCIIPSEEPQPRNRVGRIEFTRSATLLQKAGVKFKKPGVMKNLLDIKFSDGVLEIPHLMLTDETASLLRNVVAFEQCHALPLYMSDYITLLDGLIDTTKDVDLFIRGKIIENWLGDSKGVADLFNKLGRNIIVSDTESYFARVYEDLNDYFHSPWHHWKAILKQEYFKNPWAGISVIAAVILLILTFIQTGCSNNSIL
ncbi:unnamed protein product [Ilex paraguariensis]|uniref:Uncharacterized protein n=1 Tax=Ilex paraguariensis TaxID=185542 RepID=A0ABC8SGZ0_9AQUA